MYRYGMGIFYSDTKCAPNSIKIEASVVAIVIDENDIISDIFIDSVDNRIPIIDGSIAAADRTTIFKTRYESRNFYGENSKIAKWCMEADSFRSTILGKSTKDFSSNKSVYPLDLNIATCRAIQNSQKNSFSASTYKLNLSVSSQVDKTTTNSTKTNPGLACIFSYFSSVVIDDDGKILSVLLDSIEPKISYDNEGNILERSYEGSLAEIGDYDIFLNKIQAKLIGLKSNEIESIIGQSEPKELIYLKLIEKASICKKTALVNSISHRFGEKVEIPITD